MECIANMAGCILADIAAPAYAGYGLRAQDGGARLDLLRGIVSLHGVDGDASTREARLRRFWTDTRSRNRELRFLDDGRAVEVRQFDASRGAWWKDREVGVSGQRVSVRVDLEGRRILQKKGRQ